MPGFLHYMPSYKELLLDPRWQIKRLEIMQLDAFKCRVCESKTKTLHVHHLYYISGNDPWDYPNDALVTMCKDCHANAPNIDWQRAFLDLNMTERDLLDLAINIKFRKYKHDFDSLNFVSEKGNRSLFPFCWYDLFNSMEEVDEYYNTFLKQYKNKYING